MNFSELSAAEHIALQQKAEGALVSRQISFEHVKVFAEIVPVASEEKFHEVYNEFAQMVI